MARIDKVVLVTKQTPLQELVQRFSNVGQARFYIEQSGKSFAPIQSFSLRYAEALTLIRESIPEGIHFQEIDRSFLPNFLFGPNDLVVTLGPDGLVVNTAKYLDQQQIVAFNPDPTTIDGVLAPFFAWEANNLLRLAVKSNVGVRKLTMGQATLNDGQTLFAVNDFFVGQKTHVSARYEIQFLNRSENQSSSGIIVSTGAGSTGWYRSIVKGALAISDSLHFTDGGGEDHSWSPDNDELRFSVREPFESRATGASICSGVIVPGLPLVVTSQMPQNGVIFSDGVEEDFLAFNSGSSVTIRVADRFAWLAER
ncbi:MAG: sugar kinase [Armatimonadota bacterium]